MIINILNNISNKLWIFTSVIIIYTGIFYMIKLNNIQLNIIKMIKCLFYKEENKNGLNSFNTLMLSLAGRIGVGSIAGIALSIYLNGPGTIFWICLISIITTPLSYAETFLGIKYKEKDSNNMIGGPSFYISKGLNKRKLSIIYSILIIITYLFGFISIQANTITKAITNYKDINPLTIGIILSIITLSIIIGGIKKISKATSNIVPIMSLLYISLALYITISNIKLLPSLLNSIISNAFNLRSFRSSFLPTLIMGIQRGIFSNEAGIGTNSIASSSGQSNNPISSGYIQMLGTYITSFLVCTSTAVIILTSNYKILNIKDPNGIEIASNAFNYHLSNNGIIVLLILIILFAFSTILSGYYYSETSIKFIFKTLNKKHITLLKSLTTIVIIIGSIISPSIIWKFTDTFIALLALINIYALYKLRNEIHK